MKLSAAAIPAALWEAAALALLLIFYAGIAVDGARRTSVTVDELGHLPSGLLYLETGDPRFASLNPPLLNALSALPVLFLDLASDPPEIEASDDPFSFWSTGYLFMEHHRADYLRIFAAARAMPIAITAALGVLLFAWARELAPQAPAAAGLLAAGLVLLSPGVLAHARLVGTDTGTAAFVALALFALRRMLLRPTPAAVAVAGIALGLAELAKFYALLLYPVLLGLCFLWARASESPDSGRLRAFARFAAVIGISWLVLDSGYLWSEFGRSLSELSLQSEALKRWQGSGLGRIPIPLPGAYLRAFDGQALEVASGNPSFLAGELFQGGRWWYFPVVLAIKTPLPLLIAFAAAVGLGLRRSDLPARESALLLSYPALLLLLGSVGDRRQLGARALLSAVPLVQLWVAVTLARAIPRRWLTATATLLLVWLGAVTLRAHPHHLAYFNEFAGGVERGYRVASDANIDIGQELPSLAEYLGEEGVGRIQLLYFGSVDPALYGIDYAIPAGGQLEPGLLAVSVSLYHLAYPMYDHGHLTEVGPVRVPGEPIRSIGGSIHVYRIGPP